MTDTSTDAVIQRLISRVRARGGRPEDVLVRDERLPARPARMQGLIPRLPNALGQALRQRGVTGLYAHQTEAIQAVRSGANVVITTPTASGKSYAFNLPVLERLLERPGRRALYLYPTKALMNDQLRGLQELIGQLDVPVRPRVDTLSGDLPAEFRRPLRQAPPDILLANPDIVHYDLLRRHSEWRGFLAALDVLVLDELHDYRGVFGSNVALVLRRLLRLAERYGAHPTCIAASATIANPEELAEALHGRPFRLIDGDGAGTGARRFLVWRPPLLGPAEGNRHAGVESEATALFVDLVRQGRRVILFGQSRAAVERIFGNSIHELGPSWKERISAYRSGYTPAERVAIESGLRDGRLQAVVTTNALELGIDIGGLDTAILAGYPGSIMSTWQRAGRVGRRADQEALIILIAGDDALDQYYATHPDRLFGARSEAAAVDPNNPQLLVAHLLCAAVETPLADSNLGCLPADTARVASNLERSGVLVNGRLAAHPTPAYNRVAIRGAAQDATYTVVDGQRTLGSLEQPYLQREGYPGAVYLHNGTRYRVVAWDADKHQVQVEREWNDTRRTEPRPDVLVQPAGSALASRPVLTGGQLLTVSLGPVRATESLATYRELARPGGRWAEVELPKPLTFSMETIGLWIDVPAELGAAYEHLHALEHALVNVFPLQLLTDRRDIGSTSTPSDGPGGRVTLFDQCAGGAGLCERGFQEGMLEALFAEAIQLVRDCRCLDGCPSCLHLAGCGRGNDQLDKAGALALLQGRPVRGHRTDTPKIPAYQPVAPLSENELDRRVREVVADEQRLRLQTPLAPAPVAIGSRVATSFGPARVLEVTGNRVKVQYEASTAWGWLNVRDLRR